MSAEQAGLLYYIPEQFVAIPNTIEGLRLFRRLSDGLYYVKHSDNTIELFSAGLGPIVGNNSIFEQTVDSGNILLAETDLYVDQIPANTLLLDGDLVKINYAVRLADTLNAKVIRLYLFGTKIFESIIDYSTGQIFDLNFDVSIMRTSAVTAKTVVSYTGTGVTESQINDIAGMNFTVNNAVIISGQGSANNDIIAKFDKGTFVPKS